MDATNYWDASRQILSWARDGRSTYTCVANVHVVMESFDDPTFQEALNRANLVTPDGRPLVWALRSHEIRRASQVRGHDLTMLTLAMAAREGIPVGFYGGTEKTLRKLLDRVHHVWPKLTVAYAYSPPFRPLSESDEQEVAQHINSSGARILFVGLGCPKQELWMSRQAGKANVSMIGVGAAFDFLSGQKKQAPVLLQKLGLEWLHRLMSEPRRLWKRYLKHNPRFVFLFIKQLIATKRDTATF